MDLTIEADLPFLEFEARLAAVFRQAVLHAERYGLKQAQGDAVTASMRRGKLSIRSLVKRLGERYCEEVVNVFDNGRAVFVAEARSFGRDSQPVVTQLGVHEAGDWQDWLLSKPLSAPPEQAR